jgi:hypothetical protein
MHKPLPLDDLAVLDGRSRQKRVTELFTLHVSIVDARAWVLLQAVALQDFLLQFVLGGQCGGLGLDGY